MKNFNEMTKEDLAKELTAICQKTDARITSLKRAIEKTRSAIGKGDLFHQMNQTTFLQALQLRLEEAEEWQKMIVMGNSVLVYTLVSEEEQSVKE